MALSIAVARWDLFLLVLVRAAAMVMVAPVLGARSIPAQVKIGLSVLLAMLLTPLQEPSPPLLVDWFGIMLAVAREAVVGLLLGFSATLVFNAAQMAAHLIGVQIGFGFANTMDPLSPQQSSYLDTLYNLLAVVTFLSLGGHHALIMALGQSFQLVPLGQFAPTGVIGDRLAVLASATFATAVRLAMPVVGTMLVTDAAMALVVRTIPQMNVFVVGLPVKMVVGLLALIALAPVTVEGLGNVTRSVAAAVAGILL